MRPVSSSHEQYIPVLNKENFLNLLNNKKIKTIDSAIFNLKGLAKEINPGEMNSKQRKNLWMLLYIALKKDENDLNESLHELKKKLMQYAKPRHNKFKIAFGMFYGLNFISLFVPLVLKKLYPQKSFFKYNLYLAILLSLFSVSTLFVSSYKLSSRFKSKVDQFTCGIEFIDDQELENTPEPISIKS